MFPEHKMNIVYNPKFKTIFDIMGAIFNSGVTDVVFVAGSDRVVEFKSLLGKYNGLEYDFDSIDVVSAGQRDPDSEGVSGMSASKMRAAAASNDYNTFRQGLPPNLGEKDARKLFMSVRKGMNMEEDFDTMLSSMIEDEMNEMSMMSSGEIAGASKKRNKKLRNKKLKTNY